jgi:hypothetical protein
LPETADGLCAVARSLGADTGEILIDKRTTETEIKRLSTNSDLARYRILRNQLQEAASEGGLG